MLKKSPQRTFSFIAIGLIIALAIVLILFTNLAWYLVWFVSLTVITFLMYGYDKTQAKLGGWRAPEIVLHGLALLGGFIGGWLGRAVFRHKTQKLSFTIVLTISTVLYAGLALWLAIR